MPLEDHAERVLDLVATIPEGRVLAYGDIAKRLGGMGPRTVGTVMSRYGSDVPWWRVIRSDGRPPQGLEDEAVEHWRAEGTPMVRRSRRRRPGRHGAGAWDFGGAVAGPGAAAAGPRGGLHHVEIWVEDIAAAGREWGWLLGRLGYHLGDDWGTARRGSWARSTSSSSPGPTSWRDGTSASAQVSTTLPSMAVRAPRSTRSSTRVPRAGGR